MREALLSRQKYLWCNGFDHTARGVNFENRYDKLIHCWSLHYAAALFVQPGFSILGTNSASDWKTLGKTSLGTRLTSNAVPSQADILNPRIEGVEYAPTITWTYRSNVMIGSGLRIWSNFLFCRKRAFIAKNNALEELSLVEGGGRFWQKCPLGYHGGPGWPIVWGSIHGNSDVSI